METKPTGAQDPRHSIIRDMLLAIGDDPDREGLQGTPARVVRSWDKLFGGYNENPEDVLSTTFKEINQYNQMVLLTDIELHSTCEHHILPFVGKAHIGYIPRDKVVGISKLARLVECFARRLQIQERLTQQIADAMQEYLNPLGAGVIIEAQHQCMIARGVEKPNSWMKTSALIGNFNSNHVKDEFHRLCGY